MGNVNFATGIAPIIESAEPFVPIKWQPFSFSFFCPVSLSRPLAPPSSFFFSTPAPPEYQATASVPRYFHFRRDVVDHQREDNASTPFQAAPASCTPVKQFSRIFIGETGRPDRAGRFYLGDYNSCSHPPLWPQGARTWSS